MAGHWPGPGAANTGHSQGPAQPLSRTGQTRQTIGEVSLKNLKKWTVFSFLYEMKTKENNKKLGALKTILRFYNVQLMIYIFKKDETIL